MKTLVATFILALAFALQSAFAEKIERPAGTDNPAFSYDSLTCRYSCPTSHPTQIGPSEWDGAVACDPSFISYERAWSSMANNIAANAKRGPPQSGMISGVSADVEKALVKALNEARTPDRAWSVAAEAWKLGVPAELQRQALALVRSISKPSANTETLSFMLSALDNPAGAMERCLELGRGTAPDRKLAADRLALLLQNPNLADRLK